jgi:acyl-coenzyme A synthetase/AMP-(fatty) acid ligase
MYAYILPFAAAAILAIAFVIFRKKSSATMDVRVSASSANNVIFTTYFCRKLDPIRKVHAPCNDFSYIAPWYTSMQELGLYGVIFHDGMSREFIERYQTEKIRFEYIDPREFAGSLNDYRSVIHLHYPRCIRTTSSCR